MIKLKNLIYEGKYDSLVTNISKEIINRLKKHIQDAGSKIGIEFVTEFKVRNFKKYFIDMKELKITASWTNSDKIYVEGETRDPYGQVGNIPLWKKGKAQIIIEIFAPFEKTSFSIVVPQIKSTLRHEIEHNVQYFKRRTDISDPVTGRKLSSLEPSGGEYSLMMYLTSPIEIPAKVQGAYKLAKSKKIPLDKAFDFSLKDIKLDKQSKELVKKKWTEYAKKMIRSAQWSK